MHITTFIALVLSLIVGGCNVTFLRGETQPSDANGVAAEIPVANPFPYWQTKVQVGQGMDDSLIVECQDPGALQTINDAFLYGKRRGWMFVAIFAYNPKVAPASGDPMRQGIGNCRLMTPEDFKKHPGDVRRSLLLQEPPSYFTDDTIRGGTSRTAPSRLKSDGITRG